MNENNKLNLVFYGVKYFPSKGGTSRVVENLIKHLIKDFNISLYCYKDPNASTYFDGLKTIQFRKLPFSEIGVFFYFFFTAIHLLIFGKKGSIVHAHKTDCAVFVPLLRFRFKVVLTSHEAPYHRDKWTSIGKLYFKIMERIYIHSGALLTSISSPLTNYYHQKYKKDIVYIPNGIDPINNINLEKANNILIENGIETEFVLFAARRIMSTKGCHTMLDALNKINYQFPVVIAGELNHAKQYVKNLKENYANLNLKFIGFVAELEVLAGLIKRTKLFVFPSEFEGMSIMFLEVASIGSHIISSDIPENLAVFNENEMLFFKNKDSQDLADKISWANNNPLKMDEFVLKAANVIRHKYSWHTITDQYKKLYLQLQSM